MELQQPEARVMELLRSKCPPWQAMQNTKTVFVVAGSKPALQGRQNNTRFYLLPVSTYAGVFSPGSRLKVIQTGKSYFNLKSIVKDGFSEVEDFVNRSINLYHNNNLI